MVKADLAVFGCVFIKTKFTHDNRARRPLFPISLTKVHYDHSEFGGRKRKYVFV